MILTIFIVYIPFYFRSREFVVYTRSTRLLVRLRFENCFVCSVGRNDSHCSPPNDFRVRINSNNLISFGRIGDKFNFNLFYCFIGCLFIFFPFFCMFAAKSKCIDSNVTKCMCDRMAYIGDIIGEVPDRLFSLPVAEIESKVVRMNHSTRFWLAFKFLRLLKDDFVSNVDMNFPYSRVRICALLGVNRVSILKFIKKHGKEIRISELLPQYMFKSPIEHRPQGHERFFKKFALNYNDLLESGSFNCRGTHSLNSKHLSFDKMECKKNNNMGKHCKQALF